MTSSSSSSSTINIAASAQKLNVDNRIALCFYFRIADNILRQAHSPHRTRATIAPSPSIAATLHHITSSRWICSLQCFFLCFQIQQILLVHDSHRRRNPRSAMLHGRHLQDSTPATTRYTELEIAVPEIGIVGLNAENLGIGGVWVDGDPILPASTSVVGGWIEG